jgi:hypothetical protein
MLARRRAGNGGQVSDERDELPPASGRDGGMHSCAPRAGKVERVRRHARIAELLGRATPSGMIVTRVATEFKISERQARTDLAKVRDRWSREIAKDEPHRRARLLATLDHAICEAITDRAWGPVVAGCRELARICGFDAPTKMLVSTGVTQADLDLLAALKMTPAQRLAEIDKLKREIAAEVPPPAAEPEEDLEVHVEPPGVVPKLAGRVTTVGNYGGDVIGPYDDDEDDP